MFLQDALKLTSQLGQPTKALEVSGCGCGCGLGVSAPAENPIVLVSAFWVLKYHQAILSVPFQLTLTGIPGCLCCGTSLIWNSLFQIREVSVGTKSKCPD